MSALRAIFALALTLLAGSAGAATFSLGGSFVIDGTEPGNPGVVGTINRVTTLGGPLFLTDGTIDFATQDIFVFDVTLAAGSLSVDEIAVTVGSPNFFNNPVGVGAYDDAGLQTPFSVTADPVINLEGLFDFNGTALDAGETSVRLFLVHEPQGDLAAGQLVNFSISAGTNFTAQAVLAVPEPSTLLLLTSALAALALSRRHR